jgi:DNA-binding response OmpR family regulator
MRILLIEDDQNIVDFIKIVLKVGIPEAEVVSTHLGSRGVDLMNEHRPNIILLDLGLPDISGFEVLKQIRKISKVPVLIISVRDSEFAIAEGLALGADDYIIKPARQIELLARIQNLLRRHDLKATVNPIIYGSLSFDKTLQEVQIGGNKVPLTKTEGEILYQLMLSNGEVVTTSALSKSIWGSDYNTAGNIKVYIYQLRQKLELDLLNRGLSSVNQE